MKNNVLIIGDSYSTFKGFIPEDYAFYYSEEEREGTGVTRVEETWWHLLKEEANLNILLNDSWSGSTIGYTGYNGNDTSKSSSFIYRLRRLKENGFFEENRIDKVFVFGGTNDSWCGAPLGEIKTDNISENDLYNVLPAIYYFFASLKEFLPKTKIYCLMNTNLLPEIYDCFNTVCEKLDILPIKFEHITKNGGHPNIQGMIDIKNAVLKAL
ncbi:MAG: hypothetical protein E7565_06140 [Ruminococcaceae bacterium]|nr:hypothetical protein [Oscillospiraceae bacterium]